MRPRRAPDELLTAGGLLVEWSGPTGEPVVTITLDRPEVRNAQTPATWRALAAVADSLPGGTRAVVLRANGSSFSAGLDLRMFGEGVPGEARLADLGSMDPGRAERTIAGYQQAFTWLCDGDHLSVAVVQGAAVGAGFQLALACDVVVCASDARFAMKEPTLGLVPDLGGTYPLVRAVGYQRALEMCLTGRWVDAQEAHRLGLVLQVAPVGDQDQVATALLEAMLTAPAPAGRATRALLREAREHPPHEQRQAERRAQVELLRGLVAAARA